MSKPRVLIIEDDPDLLADLPRLLSTYDMDAEAVTASGAEQRFKDGSFDSVILDLKLPPPNDMTDKETDSGRLTGVVLCKRLREIDKKVPILVLTSVSDPQAHALVREAGADHILQKPEYPDEIYQQIKRLLRRSSTEESGPA